MLSSFWHWYVVIITVLTILACFWILQWTKGISNRDEDGGTGTTGHVWDEDLVELNHPLPRWWLQLFYITIGYSFLYMALYGGLGNFQGVLGWTQVGQYETEMKAANDAQEAIFTRYRALDNEALINDPEANATGQRLFANSCSMCHGSDARGARGFPNLTDNDWLYGDNFDTVMQSITDGRAGIMPVMVGALDDAAINELVVMYKACQAKKPMLAWPRRARKTLICCASPATV
jgi:cytochrome c oxidase cbb3-type subunit 3